MTAAELLLREVMDAHSDPDSADYNECDQSPCRWCSDAAQALLTAPWVIAPDGKSAGRIFWQGGQTQAAIISVIHSYACLIHRNELPPDDIGTRTCICAGRVNAETLEEAMRQADAMIRDLQTGETE